MSKRLVIVVLASLFAAAASAGGFLLYRLYDASASAPPLDIVKSATGDASSSLDRDLANLPLQYRAPLRSYLSANSIPPAGATSFGFISLGESWGTANIPEPPVKKRLLSIAKREGLAPGDCIWLQYDTSREEVSLLLGYGSERWRELAVRRASQSGEQWTEE